MSEVSLSIDSAQALTFKRLFFVILGFKIVAFIVYASMGFPSLYEVTDANAYHAIATGSLDKKYPWGLFLKTLNNVGLYSRDVITYLTFTVNCLLIPWLMAKVLLDTEDSLQAIDWVALIAVSVYPTLTFFATDIYRDSVMVAMFLFLIWIARKVFREDGLREAFSMGFWSLALVVFVISALFWLRFYLVAAMIIAFVAAYFINVLKRPLTYLAFYVATLLLADALGLYDWMKGDYRASYEGAGSAYAVSYLIDGFLMAFTKSFFYSIYGFSFSNLFSYLFFVLESVPAMFATWYVFHNRRQATRFINFLIIFFFIYVAAWNVGVDALGTAVRYRIFNYLALCIAACLIYKNKRSHCSVAELV